MPESRAYVRITHQNVPSNHLRIALSHPKIEAVIETRYDAGEDWRETFVVDISTSIQDTRIETKAGEAVKLWLGVIAFDVAAEEVEPKPYYPLSPADEARFRREMVDS